MIEEFTLYLGEFFQKASLPGLAFFISGNRHFKLSGLKSTTAN